MDASLAIVVPVFNRFKKTLRFIDCLEGQDYSCFTLVLCDSGSNDGTDLLPYYSKIKVQYVECKNDDWWTAATNKGVQWALDNNFDYILTINDDSWIPPSYLKELLTLAMNKNIDVLGSRVDFFDQPGVVWSIGAYSKWNTRHLFQLCYYNEWYEEIKEEFQGKDVLKVEALCGNGVLVKSDVFRRIGVYNEAWCPHYHADSEFIMRCKSKGIDVYTTTEIVVYNDVNNTMDKAEANEENNEVIKRSLGRTLKDLFFTIRSDLFWKPIIYIVWKYCPVRYKIQTLLYYYGHWIFVLFFEKKLNDFLSSKSMKSRTGLRIKGFVGYFQSKWRIKNAL